MHSAYIFDAYGTLFDVHAAVRKHAARLGPDAQALSDLWRAKQLEYSWVLTLMGAYRDFRALTEDALDFAFARFPNVDGSLRGDLLAAYWSLDCYPDVPQVLKALKDSGARIAILSNGSPDMLASAVKSAALDTVIDEIFSVDAVKRFKTDPAVYEMVTTAWRLYPHAISFQSSNRWDIAGASHFGFRTVWVNRTAQPDEYLAHAPDIILPSLEGLLTI